MNSLDIVLLVIIGIAIVWGLRTGVLKTTFAAAGVLIGWWLAGRFADDVGALMGDALLLDSIVTVAAYTAIIAASVIVAAIIGNLLRPLLVIGTLGAAGLADRLGGALLGLVVGLVIAGAVIAVLTRLAVDFTVDVPGVAAIESQRQILIDWLTGSGVVDIFLNVRAFLPGSLLGFMPDDFSVALDIIEDHMA